jgi:O-antigen/teichoic acid export membrane protein
MSFKVIAIRSTATSVVAAAICIAMLSMGYGAWSLVASQLATAISALVGAMLSIAWRPRWHFNGLAIRELTRFGLFATANRIISAFSVDQILVGILLGAGPLGLLNVARRIIDVLGSLIAGALNAVSYTLLSSLQDEPAKRREAFLLAVFLSSTASFPIFLGLAAIAGDLVPFAFGAKWVGAILPLQAFCGVGLLASIGILQSALIRSAGYADWWTWYTLTKQILTGIVVVLLHSHGLAVVAIGVAALNFLCWPAAVAMSTRILTISAVNYLQSFGRPLAASIMMVVAIKGIQAAMPMSEPLLRLGVLIPAGALIYGIATIIVSGRRITTILQLVRQAFGANGAPSARE